MPARWAGQPADRGSPAKPARRIATDKADRLSSRRTRCVDWRSRRRPHLRTNRQIRARKWTDLRAGEDGAVARWAPANAPMAARWQKAPRNRAAPARCRQSRARGHWAGGVRIRRRPRPPRYSLSRLRKELPRKCGASGRRLHPHRRFRRVVQGPA